MSIAAYRDPELAPTIEDCLAKARFPERLRFGVCWQHEVDEARPASFSDPRVRVVDVHWTDSRGVCWARAETMKLWRGEEWFLQLDSHHRFVPGWDAVLREQAAACDSPRPVLTSYAPAYTPGAPLPAGSGPMRIDFDRFSGDGIPMLRPGPVRGWEQRARPYRARFASGHLLFAPGRFAEDVPWDPDLYYTGDEITLTVRAFTHGYDLFMPSRLVLWHAYATRARHKHWDDHLGEATRPWQDYEATSRRKIRRLLTDPWVGELGCGPQRTVADYEAYAGISFRHQRVQEYTRLHREPPNPPAPPDWAEREAGTRPEAVAAGDDTRMSRLVETWLDKVRTDLEGLLDATGPAGDADRPV